jgi:hypothetical protein
MVPMSQVMLPLVTVTPGWLLETNVDELSPVPPGIVWLKTTSVAVLGPWLTTVATYVESLPATTVLGVTNAETAKSAEGPTLTVKLAVVFCDTGSVSKVLSPTCAVSVMLPVVVGLTVTVTTALAPTGKVPKVASKPPVEMDPWLVVAEIKFTLAGSWLVNTTPVAV